MLEVLYYDRKSIYKTLAESLVIGGLPMRTDEITTEKLHYEVVDAERCIKFLDDRKENIIEKVYNDKKYLGLTDGVRPLEEHYLIEFGKYYRRGKALGQVKSGSGHNSMYKGVAFNMVIKFPLYWLKEYQRYHFTDIISSQSTMHKILEFDLSKMFSDEVDPRCVAVIEELRDEYNNESDKDKKKDIWRKIINSCPDGLHMCMGITMNYLQAISMIQQRENHKLSDWSEDLIPFLLDLPLLKLLMIK